MKIGIIRETKTPQDNRVPFSPHQCADLLEKYSNLSIAIQPSQLRCFSDEEYVAKGIAMQEDLSDCDVLFGVKEVKIESLIPHKTYCFFSHTKKKQAYNKPLMKALISNNIRLIDYECLTHDDGQRVLGFGYFAGVVGAHNGLLTYGKKWQHFSLEPAHTYSSYEELVRSYYSLKIPSMKIAVTGTGRVASGVLEIMNVLAIKQVSAEDYVSKNYQYPVYVHLSGKDLYQRKTDQKYFRDEFHAQPHLYDCIFAQKFSAHTDLLMNGIYWDASIDRLFEYKDLLAANFRISVISDITCDEGGSVPINMGASTIANPVYGYSKSNNGKTNPFQASRDIIDVMAVDNLPNELPRDASEYFGEFLEKFIMDDLIAEDHTNAMLQRATICNEGKLGRNFEYLSDYAYN
jgi:saccharopine dehydrogenase (NAD+, L-lysine forming)